jgi:hypothetical protein
MHIRKFQSGLLLLLLVVVVVVVVTSSLVIRMLSQRVNKRRSGAIITSTSNAIVTTPTLSQFNPQVDLQFIIFVNAFSTPIYINYSAFVCFTHL